MLTNDLKNKFRNFAQDGFGDDVVHFCSFAWIVFRISATRAICVRQNGGIYDNVEVRAI